MPQNNPGPRRTTRNHTSILRWFTARRCRRRRRAGSGRKSTHISILTASHASLVIHLLYLCSAVPLPTGAAPTMLYAFLRHIIIAITRIVVGGGIFSEIKRHRHTTHTANPPLRHLKRADRRTIIIQQHAAAQRRRRRRRVR